MDCLFSADRDSEMKSRSPMLKLHTAKNLQQDGNWQVVQGTKIVEPRLDRIHPIILPTRSLYQGIRFPLPPVLPIARHTIAFRELPSFCGRTISPTSLFLARSAQRGIRFPTSWCSLYESGGRREVEAHASFSSSNSSLQMRLCSRQ